MWRLALAWQVQFLQVYGRFCCFCQTIISSSCIAFSLSIRYSESLSPYSIFALSLAISLLVIVWRYFDGLYFVVEIVTVDTFHLV